MRRSQEPRKEFSLFRNKAQAWDPKNQRPEMWKLYNTKINKGEKHSCVPDFQLDRKGHMAVHSERKN